MRPNDDRGVTESFSKHIPPPNAFEYLFENASDAIYILDTHGNFVAVNRKAEELTGFKREEFIGKSFKKIIPAKSYLKAARGFLDVIRGKSIRLELELKTATKKTLLVEVTSTPFISDGITIGTLGIVRDITEHKKAEKALQESEERFRTLMEETPISICNVDLTGKITYVNKSFEEATGYSRDEVVGKNGFKLGLMSDETLKLFAGRMKERLIGKPSRLSEGRFKRKDGEWIWAEVEGRVIKKFGVPVGFQLTARDITERKRAEEERKRYEEKLSALNTYSRNLNTARSMEDIYELTLEAVEKTLGFEFADILILKEKTLCLATHRGYSRVSSLELPLDGEKGVTARAARTGKPVSVPDISKEEAYVEGGLAMRSELAVPIEIGNKVLGVLNVESKELDAFNEKDQELLEILAFHAATAMSNLEHARNLEKQAREIRESQEKFERFFMDNPEAAVYVSSDFRVLDVNPRFTKLFGYSLDEIKEKHIDDVVVQGDRKEEAEMLNREALKGYFYHETIRKRKDGILIPVSISVARITVEGKVIGAVGLYRDITERKQMERKLEEYSQHLEELVDKRTKELKETQEQLLKAERLAAIGEVAAMVGHDLRNPLTGIGAATYYLKKKLGPEINQKAMEMLELIEKDIEHSNNIITDLLEYSRDVRLELTETNPKFLVNEALLLVELPQNIQVLDSTRSEPKIRVDSERMKRVFVNIIKNAVDAMSEGGILTITSNESNGSLEMAFADTGAGMSEEVLAKLWTPLFTTKAEGMGLGLSVCKRFVEAHGGTISVESVVVKGTRFTVTIPVKSEFEGGKSPWKDPQESSLSMTTRA